MESDDVPESNQEARRNPGLRPQLPSITNSKQVTTGVSPTMDRATCHLAGKYL
jgi:hypothetical protein